MLVVEAEARNLSGYILKSEARIRGHDYDVWRRSLGSGGGPGGVRSGRVVCVSGSVNADWRAVMRVCGNSSGGRWVRNSASRRSGGSGGRGCTTTHYSAMLR